MKILFIKTTKGWYDGIHIVLRNILNYINHDDVTIDVVIPEKPINSFTELVAKYDGNIYCIDRSTLHPFSYINKLKSIIRQNNYDIVHAHGNSHTLVLEMFAAFKAGCRVRISHSHNTSCKHKLLHFLLTPLFNLFCNCRMACGESAGRWLFGKKSFVVLNNGIDTSKFLFSQEKRVEIRKKLDICENAVLIGHVGTFLEAKNHSFLVDLFALLSKNKQLILIGDGPLKSEITKKCQELRVADRVIFLGTVINVEDYLNAIDIIVMPSLFEGLPLSLIEEQGNGLKCIVSDNVSTEVDKTGNLVFLPLSDLSKWTFEIENYTSIDRLKSSVEAINQIKLSGYDIVDECTKLKGFYINECSKAQKQKRR